MTTPAQLFAEIGEALYGELWQSPLAARLDMNLRTVQRIAAAARDGADYPVAPGVWAELTDICRALALRHGQLLEAILSAKLAPN